jgi:peptidoglycan/LPS O-acetylase OafA/YrhL
MPIQCTEKLSKFPAGFTGRHNFSRLLKKNQVWRPKKAGNRPFFLGDVCYCTYLLHGVILFAAFKFGIGMEVSRGLSAFGFSLVIFCLTPVLVLASFPGYKYVEKPFMHLAKKLIAGCIKSSGD